MSRAKYGIEHWQMVKICTFLGAILLTASFFFLTVPFRVLAMGFFLWALVLYMPSRIGKLFLREDLLRLLRPKGSELILDVGTGWGLVAIGLAKSLKEGHAYGIDISANALRNAEKNADIEGVSRNTSFVHGDARSIPFPDGYFDIVVANFLMPVVAKSERDTVLKELYRVAKPGGRIVISDLQRYAAALEKWETEETLVCRPRRLTSLFFFPVSIRIVITKK